MAAALVFRLHDRGPALVREVLLERGWEEYDEGRQEPDDWNLYWRGSAFRNPQYHSLLPWQRLNHHPQTASITRKDLLARNLRRMRATVGSVLYDFSPTAFILPTDFTRFLAEYSRLHPPGGPSAFWICKPVDLSRGRGIFLFEDIKDLVYDCSVIVQRYVSDPLLVSGYKFDLRIYVCVKSFRPLTVYIHQEGLVRFATEKYDLASLRNVYAHLTNTSINKLGPFYKSKKGRVGPGCKWTLSQFRHFLHSQDVNERLLWQRINNIVTLTLLTIAPTVPRCPNCVELFGFDVLIDARFKPWLLEVNYSPALTLDCQADTVVKKSLIGDLIDLMNYTPADRLRDRAYQGQRRCRGNKPSHVHTLPLLKDPTRSERTERRTSRRQNLVSAYQARLPPVGPRDTHINTAGTENPILGTDSGATPPATAPRLTRASEVTETEAEVVPDVPHGRLGFRAAAASWKLPNIYSFPPERNGPPVPPPRVGGFIRTFPFNAATLKASQPDLDLRTVTQELHKLTAELAGSRRDAERPEAEAAFESLLWGPRDPPPISQRFTAT